MLQKESHIISKNKSETYYQQVSFSFLFNVQQNKLLIVTVLVKLSVVSRFCYENKHDSYTELPKVIINFKNRRNLI